MKHITTADALRALEEAVAEKGEDYVYEPQGPSGVCHYVRGGQPSCIVGDAMHRLGVPIPKLEEWGTKKFIFLPAHWLPAMDADAREAFTEAQEIQDTGGSWGRALDTAKAATDA